MTHASERDIVVYVVFQQGFQHSPRQPGFVPIPLPFMTHPRVMRACAPQRHVRNKARCYGVSDCLGVVRAELRLQLVPRPLFRSWDSVGRQRWRREHGVLFRVTTRVPAPPKNLGRVHRAPCRIMLVGLTPATAGRPAKVFHGPREAARPVAGLACGGVVQPQVGLCAAERRLIGECVHGLRGLIPLCFDCIPTGRILCHC